MVTPLSKNINAKFPLFEKLLSESRTRYPKEQNNNLVCPATAPVILYMEPERHDDRDSARQGDIHPVHRGGNESDTDSNLQAEKQVRTDMIELSSQIVLQDPPKTKLKRQLSIDTKERTEALRVRKKAFIDAEESHLENDEVDGEQPKQCPADINKYIPEVPVQHHPLYKHSSAQVRDVPVTAEVEVIPTRPSLTPCLDNRRQKGLSDIVYERAEHTITYETDSVKQRSPNLFNLSDIGLTSPFATLTPKGSKGNERDVFVFPEHVPPRKPSPYKAHPVREDTDFPTDKSEFSSEYSCKQLRDLSYLSDKIGSKETSSGKSLSKHESDPSSSYYAAKPGPSHISSRGFVWPDKVTITEPVLFSPRIVTTSAKPSFPTTSPSSARPKTPYDAFQKDLETLHMLEREYTRAKAIYGSPPIHHERGQRPLSPTQRKIEVLRRGTLRSFSDIDRSPNEKDILETNEDVRSKYERSFSDPRFSPRQISGLLQRPSPLSRQYEEKKQDVSEPSREMYREAFRDDVRRRLFMRGDSLNDFRRQHSSQSYSPHGSTDIPEEVLNFLHSRNFHPEELENLKDFLRHGGSPQKDESFLAHFPPYYADSGEETDRYGHLNMSNRTPLYVETPELNVRRERRHGEIDVRLSCEEITERKQRTEDLLRQLDHDGRNCKCAQIEEEIRLMAMDAYSKIRRTDRSAEAHDQFQTELQETHNSIYTSMKVLCGIKCLCKYGRSLEEIFPGSVVFRLKCPNLDALLDLWHTYKSGNLEKQLMDAFISQELLDRFDCENIKLKVSIHWVDYLDCKKELEPFTDSGVVITPNKSPLTPIHCRSRSEPASVSKQANQVLQTKTTLSPFRERICSDSSVELSPRKAFQELNAGKQVFYPPSPTKKLVCDNVFSEDSTSGQRSPLTPGRKKSFVFEAKNEQENLDSR